MRQGRLQVDLTVHLATRQAKVEAHVGREVRLTHTRDRLGALRVRYGRVMHTRPLRRAMGPFASIYRNLLSRSAKKASASSPKSSSRTAISSPTRYFKIDVAGFQPDRLVGGHPAAVAHHRRARSW